MWVLGFTRKDTCGCLTLRKLKISLTLNYDLPYFIGSNKLRVGDTPNRTLQETLLDKTYF